MHGKNTFVQRGFTLIELVVVITILAILAAFALPKFIALDSSARIAALNALAGSVRSAAAHARGMSMASQNTASVIMEGTTVTLLNSYPDGTATGIVAAVNTTPSGTDWVIQPNASASGHGELVSGLCSHAELVLGGLHTGTGPRPDAGRRYLDHGLLVFPFGEVLPWQAIRVVVFPDGSLT